MPASERGGGPRAGGRGPADQVLSAPDWVGDVGVGVTAWAGEEIPERSGDRSADRSGGRSRGRPGGRSGGRRGARRPGSEPLPPDPAVEVPEADAESVARKILLDQLTGRARTRQQLADKLAGKLVPEEIATRLLDRFEEVGLVDDEAFAREWVAQRQQGKGLARRALAQELRRKGIDDEVAREALTAVEDDDEREAARVLVRKKLRSMQGLDPQVATRRLVGMLARKGYGPGLAFAVVRDELGAQDCDDDVSFE